MILIIEGIDGSGKTSLAKELSPRLGIPVYKAEGTPQEGTLTTKTSQFIDRATVNILTVLRPDVIMDRFFPSEWVYGHVHERNVDDIEIMKLDSQMAKLDTLCVLMRLGSPFDMWGRADAHVQDAEKARGIIDLYDNYVHHSQMRWIVLDATLPILDNVEAVMLQFADLRPSKPQTYMELAKVVSRRSTCLARRCGAVLLSNDGYVIATGYNGAPKGVSHQCDCPRLRKRSRSGTDLDACMDVHAEENCIVQAAIAGADPSGGTVFTTSSPCRRCMRMLINANIGAVVYEQEYGDKEAFELAKKGDVLMRSMQELGT